MSAPSAPAGSSASNVADAPSERSDAEQLAVAKEALTALSHADMHAQQDAATAAAIANGLKPIPRPPPAEVRAMLKQKPECGEYRQVA